MCIRRRANGGQSRSREPQCRCGLADFMTCFLPFCCTLLTHASFPPNSRCPHSRPPSHVITRWQKLSLIQIPGPLWSLHPSPFREPPTTYTKTCFYRRPYKGPTGADPTLYSRQNADPSCLTRKCENTHILNFRKRASRGIASKSAIGSSVDPQAR